MSFAMSRDIDSPKVFIERKTNVTGRWDPFYYRPELVALEKQVGEVTTQRLRDFALSLAGGATPSTKDAAEHYDTTPEDGVPFIRVQNLSTTGELNLEDIKLITRLTHEGLLKRSRLEGGELLVKITGVGRMAVASVVPEGFEGNINQHMVAIRTGSIETSRTLAAYLNLDISEKLASRRATGGTRPALDYPALLSIPIVFDECIPKMLQKALDDHREKFSKAKALLASIDDLLLAELGIPNPPEPPNTLKSRMFQRQFSEVSGDRFDPHYHHPRFAHLIDRLEAVPHFAFRDLVDFSHEQWDQKSIFEETFPYIEIGAVNLEFGRLTESAITPVSEAANRAKMLVRPGDLLISLTRPTRKAICFSPEELDLAVASNGFCVVRGRKKEELSIRYLFHVLRSCLCNEQFNQRSSGGNYPAITEEQLCRVLIPWAEPKTQERIVQILDKKYAEAEVLYAQAQADLEQAKRDIEAMILGEPTEAA